MDIFTKARFKITFLYFLFGIVIVAIAGYFIHADLLAIIANMLQVLQALLNQGTPFNQQAAATVISQNIDAQIGQMDLTVGIWLIVVMVFAAYLLAGITLRPVRHAMERQKRFMANISHKLRTPLSVMKTSTETALMEGTLLTREELIETKKSNLEEIDRMVNIIEFLMNFSNFENRMRRMQFVPTDLAAVAQQATDLMQKRAKTKNVRLIVKTEPVVLPDNATALEEVALNLIENAVAYTPPGGTVWVTVVKRYGAPTLIVRDNGVGIAPHDIQNIFDAFYRGEDTAGKRENEESSGLGLAIVNELVMLHDGKISVHSDVGKGSTFIVRFPSRFSRWFTPWL